MKLQAHPWHGISPGADAPALVTCFIELVPTDTVKYEVDKDSGHLRVDRPQRYSNACPMPYGFIPQTLCDSEVAKLASVPRGDQDPIDVCVLCERPINHGGILLSARPIGGLRMIDKNEADDKIIAVLQNDAAFGAFTDIAQVPPALIDRLRHYFLTYKVIPGTADNSVQIAAVYGADVARTVVNASLADYRSRYP